MVYNLFISILVSIKSVSSVTQNDEILALSSIYYAANGDDWSWKRETQFGPQWNFSAISDPCIGDEINAWQGK